MKVKKKKETVKDKLKFYGDAILYLIAFAIVGVMIITFVSELINLIIFLINR